MVSLPVISIITPVYNGEKYISETINSVLSADIGVPYEYLVLDDGSHDSTLSILSGFGSSIRSFSHENIGESATVNRGLKNAIGEFILVLSADDPMLTGELLTEAVKILNSNHSLVALYPDWKIINDAGSTLKINILPNYSDELMIGQCLCLPGPGVVFRKDAAIKVGGRDSKWKFVGDYDFWLRLSREGGIERLPGVMAQWRDNLDSTSVSQRGERMAKERIQVIEDFLVNHEFSKDLSKKALGNANYLAARLAFFDPAIDGKKLLLTAFKIRNGWPEVAKIHEVVYLLLLPLSRKILSHFPKIKSRISAR